MNKNIENIQNDFEVEHLLIIPDGTPHYHNYIEMELVEKGSGKQIINGERFDISNHYVSILRPYIDHQSFIPHGTEIFNHDISFKENTLYNVKCGSIHIVDGPNKGKVYLFLQINNKIISEFFIDGSFSCYSVGFFAKYSTKTIEISESIDNAVSLNESKILTSDDKLSYYDISSNTGLGLPTDFLLNINDLSFYDYKKSKENDLSSFVYNCNIKVGSIGYRILTIKLVGINKEIDFLLSNEKIYISQINEENEFDIYKLCINPNIIDTETQKKLLSFNSPLCISLPDDTYENIKRVFEVLIHFYKISNKVDKDILSLVNIIFRLFFDINGKEENMDQLKKTVLTYFIDNNHFLDEIDLNDFAKYLGYESGYASRLCLKYTGYSFAKYKNHLRLQYAKHLISSTNISIAEISIKSGFNSLSVFNRFFKKETGHSPSVYRTMHK